jgi:hypothetical protein
MKSDVITIDSKIKMKEIQLIKLSLKDFQGGTFTFDADGENAFVYAANGVGKTRLFSAFTFLLFGKDSLNRSDFSLKTLDSNGDVADHGLQHTVEGILDVDGERVTLKKIYSEKFVKVRGRQNPEFSGHSTQHFIDDVPKAEKDYKSYIQEIAGDEQTFRLLTSPTAFPLLPWQKQRSLLLEIFGDVSDADIIASDPKLAALPKILGRHKAEDYKKIVSSRQSELSKALGSSKQIGTIETRIDEVRRSLPELPADSRASLDGRVSQLETELSAARLKLQGVDTGGKIADLSKQLAVVNADIQKIESTHYAETMKKVNKIDQDVWAVQAKMNAQSKRIVEVVQDLTDKKWHLERIEARLAGLREKWAAVDAQEWKDGTPDTCAACDQPLPSERVQDARAKALEAFNNDKANALAEIEESGAALKETAEKLKNDIGALEVEQHSDRVDYSKEIERIQAERDELKRLALNADSPEYRKLMRDRSELEAQINVEKSGRVADSEEIKAKITKLSEELSIAKADAQNHVNREQGEKRIADLMAEEKTLTMEAERLLSELYLIDLFTSLKVTMLNKKMSGQFELVKWKLAEVQVNGAVNDQMCELTVNGIGYNSGLNSAAKTQGGMDIIKALQRHYKLSAVIWIDNRESCTEIPDMPCQIISLVVSPADAVLRVEQIDSHRREGVFHG